MTRKGASPANRRLLLVVLLVVLAGLVIVFFSSGGGERIRAMRETPGGKPRGEGRAKPEAKEVTLYFVSERDSLLHPESREIPGASTPAEEIEQVVRELIKGSRGDLVSPLPAETRVRQVFLAKDVAYVDLSRDVIDRFAYGSSSELAAIYAVVNTITDNFKAVKRVAILVEGSEKETLGGHVDLSRPLLPQPSLVAK
jgi:germination protein M